MSQIILKQVVSETSRVVTTKNIQRSILRFISTVTQLNNQEPLHLKSWATHKLPGNLKEVVTIEKSHLDTIIPRLQCTSKALIKCLLHLK